MKIKTLTCCLFLSILLLCACTPASVGISPAETVCVTDDLNREVHVPKSPARVAALTGSFADVWVLAGGAVCATANDAWEDFSLPLENAVNIGGAHSPNAELLLAAQPDLVIASASNASNVELGELLASAAIPVLYFDVDGFEDYLRMLDVCTDLTGRKDLYRTNGTDIRDQIELLLSDFSKNAPAEQDRTVLLLRASSTFVKAKGSEGTVLGEMLKKLGMINLADSETSLLEDLSTEYILQNQPKHIFVISMGNNAEASRASVEKMMEEDPLWGELEAVREGRLHMMERSLFNLKPNARWAQAYETLIAILQEK